MEKDIHPESPYDPKETPEEELWFIPGPGDISAAGDVPWQTVERKRYNTSDWRDAERANVVPLARAAQAFGALNGRLQNTRASTGSLVQRIALLQVAELSWHLGDRLTEDRIALYLAARISGTSDRMPAFSRAGWAYGRLLQSQGVTPGNLMDFLGRVPVTSPAPCTLTDRPQGMEFLALEERFWALLSDLEDVHPITRAACAWDLWNRLELSDETARIEGAVVAAKLGADSSHIGRSYTAGIDFLPLTCTPQSGTIDIRLGTFCAGTEKICLRALMELDRIMAWREKACAATARLSGRTPARLIAALADWPMLSAEALEKLTGASRAAVHRNLGKLEALELVQEVTGQDRFRMWKAAA